MIIKIFQSSKSYYFYFRVKSNDGKTMLTSNPHETKKVCKDAAHLAKQSINNQANFEQLDAGGRPYFILKSNEGTTLAKSPIHASVSGVNAAISALLNTKDYKDVDTTIPPLLPQSQNWLPLEEGGSAIPREVIDEYIASLKRLSESINLKADTPTGQMMSGFIENISSIQEGNFGGEDATAMDFNCFGSIGTFACYGGCAGTAGTFGCSDPKDINLCWSSGSCGSCSGDNEPETEPETEDELGSF